MIDPTTLPALWHRAVETTTTAALPPHDGPVLAQWENGTWCTYRTTAEFPRYSNGVAYRVVNPDGTTGPLVERATTTTRAWAVTPPDDDTEIRVLWSDGEVSVDYGKHCQTPWYGAADQTFEIGWTTPSEFAAFLTRPAACAAVTQAMIDNAVSDVYGLLYPMDKAVRMADHITAALRKVARCAEPQVPEVVRSVLESSALTRENFARVKPTHEMAGMNADTARAIRAWLAALPPEVSDAKL